MKSILKEEAYGLTRRVLKRDFSGNTGLALKNAIYSLSTNIVSKVGSIIFVYLVMMRYLSQELFGLYSLTLSTILLFSGFADLGIGTALVKYVSKKKDNARGNIIYLFRIKLILSLIVCLALIILGYFISNNFYKKPIYLGLLAGVIYIIFMGVFNLLFGVFHAENNFKVPLYKESLFQILRILIVAIAIYVTNNLSPELVIFWIFIAISISFLLSATMFIPNMKKYKGNLSFSEKVEIKKYLLPLSVSVLSGLFFGYVDIIMLGRYLSPEFIAYYQAAFSLISSAVVFVSFSSVLFPIFSRLKKRRLDIALKKSIFITLVIGIISSLLIFLSSDLIIALIGFITQRDYNNSLPILKIFSIILITDPLIGIFSSYLYSTEKPKKVASAIIISTVTNIVLNLIFIKVFLVKGFVFVVCGVAIASVISRIVYLMLLIGPIYRSLKKKK